MVSRHSILLFGTAFAFVTPNLSVADTVPVISLAEFPGASVWNEEVAVSGTYAYVAAAGPGLEVFDVSDPTSPQSVAVVDIGTTAGGGGVAISGNYAYVTAKNLGEGLRVIDVSTPESPQVVGTYNMGAQTIGVAVSGDLVYLANRWDGLKIVDVSNPASPQYVGALGGFNAYTVVVSGDYAYLACHADGLQIVDISTPASPQWVGSYATTGTTQNVAVSATHAYVADRSLSGPDAGLQIVDITNPSSPQWVGRYETTGAVGVDVSGDYAYVTDGSGFQVIDVSDPASPLWVGGYTMTGRDVTVVDSTVYVTASVTGGRRC